MPTATLDHHSLPSRRSSAATRIARWSKAQRWRPRGADPRGRAIGRLGARRDEREVGDRRDPPARVATGVREGGELARGRAPPRRPSRPACGAPRPAATRWAAPGRPAALEPVLAADRQHDEAVLADREHDRVDRQGGRRLVALSATTISASRSGPSAGGGGSRRCERRSPPALRRGFRTRAARRSAP